MKRILTLLLLSNAVLLAQDCSELQNEMLEKNRAIIRQQITLDFNPEVARAREEKINNLKAELNQLNNKYNQQCKEDSDKDNSYIPPYLRNAQAAAKKSSLFTN